MRITLLALGFLMACGGDNTTKPDAATDGPPDPALCGGIAGTACGATEYCDFANNQCGIGDQTGICVPRPQVCTRIFAPVCACDGRIYGNECDAHAQGLDLNARGTCAPAPGSFVCGYVQCDLQTQYCVREPQEAAPDVFRCAALPACAGRSPSCAALVDEPCGNACTGDATTGLTLTCP